MGTPLPMRRLLFRQLLFQMEGGGCGTQTSLLQHALLYSQVCPFLSTREQSPILANELVKSLV